MVYCVLMSGVEFS